jgi:ABC-type sugar transport system substrate-binding protein
MQNSSRVLGATATAKKVAKTKPLSGKVVVGSTSPEYHITREMLRPFIEKMFEEMLENFTNRK